MKKTKSSSCKFMDPLSITASTVALIQAANAALKILAALSSAREDIQDATIQLSSFKDVIEQTKSCVQENSCQLSSAQISTIGGLVQAADQKMRIMGQILDNISIAPSDGGKIKVSTLDWIRCRSRVMSLLGNLTSLCNVLSTVLAVTNL